MPRVLVTGASGFIGGALIRHFQKAYPDLTVRAIDLQPPRIGGKLEVVTGSILDTNDVSRAMRGCDYVVHLAAILGVQRTDANPLECLNVNVQGTINLLEACAKHQVRRFVFASSSEVYGEPARLPVDETTPLNPRSVYANSKLAGEEYAKAYSAYYGFEHSIIRFFNVYGPGQVAEFVMPRFIREVQAGRAPVVHGDGGQVRAFCYMDDAVVAASQTVLQPEAAGEVFNIGNATRPITMKELAFEVIRVLGSDLTPNFVPLENVQRGAGREIRCRIPSIAKAQRILGYRPEITLEDGIQRVATAGGIQGTWRAVEEAAALAAQP